MANKGIRLIQAAKEFNVGISTIVDLLNDKGHVVESTPNTKLLPEMYDILLKEYQKDKDLKKESNEITIGIGKNKTENLENPKQIIESNDDIAEEKEITIKSNTTSKTEEITKIVVAKSGGPKIIGKIDISKPEKVTPTQEKPKEPEKIIVQEKPTIEYKKPEQEPTKTTQKDDDIKVVGKINLAEINQKTRPDKKPKGEIKKENIRKKEQEKNHTEIKKEQPEKIPQTIEETTIEQTQTITDKPTDSNFINTKFEKLSGPVVLGKIVLPTIPEKKDIKKPFDFNKKKKRKRVKKIDTEKVAAQPNTNNTSTKQNTNSQNKPTTENKDRRPFVKRADGTNKPPFQQNAQGGKKFTPKPEVKEVDVQKQIKDTLARLQSKGKSKSVIHRKEKRSADKQRSMQNAEMEELEKAILKITEFVSVSELASMMNVSASEVITTCMNLGLFVSINQRLDAETITLVADEFHYEVEFISIEVQEAIKDEEDNIDDLVKRPPIVTVMGHVDHGKTKLLDFIRSTNVISGEAGGITQHIGAYSVKLKNGEIVTFLDTPGHEAFTAMRARGTQITDIAIIVIAADDGIKTQTIEAINHAQAANVQIIFAINKIDKPNANPEKVKEELASRNFLVEDWGGKYQSQDISAKSGLNIEELLEKVVLESEVLELKANPNKKAIGTVIESSLDKGRGYLATILIQAGTLKIGDVLIAGTNFGHIKAMFNERGEKIKEAGPSIPVVILGLNGAPQAGDKFNVMATDSEAREIANKRLKLQREQNLRSQKHITLDEIGRRIAIGNFQELNVIIKGDVDGSIEALTDALQNLSTSEIQVNVIHKAVGQISESDVLLATASDAVIIGFQVRPSVNARRLAEKEEVEIRLYSIIYDAINELRDAMEGMLSPEIKETIIANLEVLNTFKITKVGTIAGCMVREGKIKQGSKIRLIRDGIVKYSGQLGALKRFKDDAKEVVSGLECGVSIKNFNDILVGDVIEAYFETEHQRKL